MREMAPERGVGRGGLPEEVRCTVVSPGGPKVWELGRSWLEARGRWVGGVSLLGGGGFSVFLRDSEGQPALPGLLNGIITSRDFQMMT